MREILFDFDEFMKADQKRLNRIEARQIREENKRTENACGSCKKWMTNSCKREKNHMVHCNELKCSEFDIQPFYIELIKSREIKAKELEL